MDILGLGLPITRTQYFDGLMGPTDIGGDDTILWFDWTDTPTVVESSGNIESNSNKVTVTPWSTHILQSVGGTPTYETGGQNNVAIGRSALESQVNSSGNIYNTAVGSQAGASVTTGTKNTFIGANAGNLVTNTTENTFVGYLCGDAVTTNPGSTAIGSQAFSEQGGDYNPAVGRKA